MYSGKCSSALRVATSLRCTWPYKPALSGTEQHWSGPTRAATTPEISNNPRKLRKKKVKAHGIAASTKLAQTFKAHCATVALAHVVIRNIPAVEVGVIRVIITLAALCCESKPLGQHVHSDIYPTLSCCVRTFLLNVLALCPLHWQQLHWIPKQHTMPAYGMPHSTACEDTHQNFFTNLHMCHPHPHPIPKNVLLCMISASYTI